MNLEELRTEIDAIDDTLVNAFAQRMDVVARVSQAKKEQGLPHPGPCPGTGQAGGHRLQAAPGAGAVRLCPVVHAL